MRFLLFNIAVFAALAFLARDQRCMILPGPGCEAPGAALKIDPVADETIEAAKTAAPTRSPAMPPALGVSPDPATTGRPADISPLDSVVVPERPGISPQPVGQTPPPAQSRLDRRNALFELSRDMLLLSQRSGRDRGDRQ